ncbi:MAG TPA: PIN domain-containing protein [Stellaceae bacterium]
MIYLDSSVALADLLGEGHVPPDTFWAEPLVSSQLLEYEVWTRIHGRRFGTLLGEAARALFARVRLIELTESALARALEPRPVPVRTLDALHLATIDFLRRQGEAIELASYDNRLLAAARALAIPIAAS